MNVTRLAQAKYDADAEYNAAFDCHLATFKPMDADLFWEMMDVFRDEIRSRLEYGTSVGDASHNMFCAFVYRSNASADTKVWPEDEVGRWDQMARFFARYRVEMGDRYKDLDQCPGIGRGDDSYGDLIDSIPLAGRQICAAIERGEITTDEQLIRAFDGPGMDPPDKLRDFILRGENYIEDTFETALKNAFVSVSRKSEIASG